MFVPLTNRLREVGRWKTWQRLSSAQPAVTEHRLGGLQTTDVDFSSGGQTLKIKAPPGASRAKLPALWDEAGVTRPQHTAQNHIRTQIQYLNMDISEDPEHRFSIQKKRNLKSPRLIHTEVTWKEHSIIYSPKIDFRLPRLNESKLGSLVPSCLWPCGQRSSQGSWFETLKPCTQG